MGQTGEGHAFEYFILVLNPNLQMPQTISSMLAAALRDKTLVKLTRSLEEGWLNGYVMDVGPRWFLLARVEDGVRFNGFLCPRLSDVCELQVPHRYAAFVDAAMKKRGIRRPKKPRVSVASVEGLLLSANRLFPLVTIHREKVDPDSCAIGRVAHVKNGQLSLLEINPDARDIKPTKYRLRDITRIDFGGEYEEALQLVSGPPGDSGR